MKKQCANPIKNKLKNITKFTISTEILNNILTKGPNDLKPLPKYKNLIQNIGAKIERRTY
tara:strand:+ start:270 stop:449 length:180 start_codon:yes stop_codon:yes gene_type:complete